MTEYKPLKDLWHGEPINCALPFQVYLKNYPDSSPYTYYGYNEKNYCFYGHDKSGVESCRYKDELASLKPVPKMVEAWPALYNGISDDYHFVSDSVFRTEEEEARKHLPETFIRLIKEWPAVMIPDDASRPESEGE